MQTKETAIILFSAPDKQGIVAEVAYFVSTYNGNILHASQHKDIEHNTFFMRIEWDLSSFSIPKEKIKSAFEPLAIKYNMDWQLHFSSTKINTAIFVSQLDHCLYELLIKHQSNELDCNIACIISNHQHCETIAKNFNIPYYYLPMTKDNKSDVEKAQQEILTKHNVELIVLARYMQIVSQEFVERYKNKMINIHHSFLPAFVGAKPYHQAFERGVKIIGATSHYVTSELDQGPIIEQNVTRISHRDSVQKLIQKGKDLEKGVLYEAVVLHIERKVLVFNNKTILFDY